MIIGLTGQTGSGKSTLCDFLKNEGFYTVSCDEIAAQVRSDPKIIAKTADAFGFDIINEDGSIDRRLLAQRAFKNKEALEKLNGIMHPEILLRAFEKIDKALESGYRYALLDAPQLFESGADKRCDIIVSVIADKEKRLERILKRDSISEAQALERIAAQYDDDFYIEKSDFVIINNSELFPKEKASELVRFLENKYENG